MLSIDEKLTAKLGKAFQSNFGKEGKFEVRTKAIVVDLYSTFKMSSTLRAKLCNKISFQ